MLAFLAGVSQSFVSTQMTGAPRRSRTLNLQIRSLTLYPIELWAHISISMEHNRESLKTPIFLSIDSLTRDMYDEKS